MVGELPADEGEAHQQLAEAPLPQGEGEGEDVEAHPAEGKHQDEEEERPGGAAAQFPVQSASVVGRQGVEALAQSEDQQRGAGGEAEDEEIKPRARCTNSRTSKPAMKKLNLANWRIVFRETFGHSTKIGLDFSNARVEGFSPVCIYLENWENVLSSKKSAIE